MRFLELKKNKEASVMIYIVPICKKVLFRLSKMDYEKEVGISPEQIIFPNKKEIKGNVKRISEQELRLLFIEEFKKTFTDLFYSIETPTKGKYKFGKTFDNIQVDKAGQSALLDMCLFERIENVYNRTLNIEFKHKNASIDKIGKDILKLIYENEDGAYIHLLENTDRGTICNKNETGIFNKLYKSFSFFKANWKNDNKSIQLLILSLEQKSFIYRNIEKSDLENLKEIFFIENGCGNINTIKGNGWKIKELN